MGTWVTWGAGRRCGGTTKALPKVLVTRSLWSPSLTKALALDCEMVGVGPKGKESIAARVSLVNQYGKCVYDKFVKPTEPVTDYRTAVSGVQPEHLKQGTVSRTAGTLPPRVLVPLTPLHP